MSTGAPPPDPPPDQAPDQGSDQAAEGPDGRDRLVATLRRPGSRGQVVAAVLLALLGFAAVTQVRSNGRDDRYLGARQGDLIQYINSLSLASQRAESEIARLQQTRDALGNDTQSRLTALAQARQQATTLGILAGTVRATGPGIRATVTDAGTDAGTGVGTGVGSDQLVNGIQELRDAGAEVIEINNVVRVVAQTSVQDTSRGIRVDGHSLKAPYVIEAIGDPYTLATALDFTGGFISDVTSVGGKVLVRQLAKVDVTAVRRLSTPQYALPGATR